jgi:hypothetical protein
LIKFIGRCSLRVKPDIPTFAFSEFCSISFCDKACGQSIGITICFSSDQFRSGHDVSPLVGAAHLKLAVFVFIQPVEIISLHQLIGELSK